MMKKLLFLIIALPLSLSAISQASLVVKITGPDKLSLPGASVTLSPGNHTVVSNQEGVALFSNVKPGSYEMLISYIGYAPAQRKLELSEGENNTGEVMTEEFIAGTNNVVVMGDRLKGQARALNQQKNSDNITNIVSADQIGRFPDANIGDALKRIPAITMQNDQGEARNIVVRGMGPEFNSVTLNGERIPSAEGDNRRIQMDLIPSDMVQTVEVNKTLTADMDADAIGGSVNLLTRTAPNGLRISGTLAGGYSLIRDNGFNTTASLVLGNRFANNKLGYVISGSYNKNTFGSDNIENEWLKDENGNAFVADNDVRIYDLIRIRRSVATTLDYKISPVNTIRLTGSYNWRDDKENRYRLRHRYRGDEEDFATDLRYDGAGNIVGYSNGEVLRQTKGGLDNDRQHGRRLEDQRVRALALSGDHLFGVVKTDWSVQYARASEMRPNERYIAMSRRGIDVDHNISDPSFPLLTSSVPLQDYTRMDELTEEFQDQYEEDINARLNFTVPASIISNQNGNLKFGARLRNKLKVRNNSFFEYEPLSGFENIAQLDLIHKTNPDFFPGSKYRVGDFIAPSFLGSLPLLNTSQFEGADAPAEYLAQNFNARERILAGYVSLIQNFTENIKVNMGVRLEHTSLDYEGNIVEEEEDLKGTATSENDYLDVLPSLNVRIVAAPNFIVKAAYAKSISRPKYYDLVPYFNVLLSDQELSTGNPSLQPVRAHNFDIMAEKYFSSVGILSGGVFHKRLDRFYYTHINNRYTRENFAADFPNVANPIMQGDNWDFAQRRNGDGATLTGFEVALQRQLDMLPGALKGLGIYLNYTYTYSKAENIFNSDGDLVRSNVKLPGAAPHIFNASLSFESQRLVLRASGNYTSAYVDDSDDAGYNEDPFFDRYYDKQFFLDVNGSFAITPNWRIFAEANNLTNQSLRYYQGIAERTAQAEYYGPKFTLGIKYDLLK